MTTTRYHHGNLRGALVDQAVATVRERGPQGLAVRELARRVGVSHNAAYRHFADRDALVDAVAELALAGLGSAMERRLAAVDELDQPGRARTRLREIGAGYVDYAIAEPGLFRLLFTAYPEVPDRGPGVVDAYDVLNQALDDLVGVGWLHERDRPSAEITCWAAVHGFATLCIEGPLRGIAEPDREAALTTMLTTLDRAHGTGPAAG